MGSVMGHYQLKMLFCIEREEMMNLNLQKEQDVTLFQILSLNSSNAVLPSLVASFGRTLITF